MTTTTTSTKRCYRCGLEKPAADFSSDRSRPDGLAFYCRPCSSERGKRYRADNPAYRAKADDRARRIHVLRYGITQEDYDAMLLAQNGRCAVCGVPENGTDRRAGRLRRFCIDHDHDTGEVRGLLCTPCNLMIGYADDDGQRLTAAAEYLRRGR